MLIYREASFRADPAEGYICITLRFNRQTRRTFSESATGDTQAQEAHGRGELFANE